MKLYSVYDNDSARYITYGLFAERQLNPLLSHVEKFPTWIEQLAYIHSRPYTYWYGAFNESLYAYVGMCWVDQKQSGIYVLRRYQGIGYGTSIMRMLIETHPEMPYTAYIHPKNTPSLRLHERLGFERDHIDANGQVVLKYNGRLSR